MRFAQGLVIALPLAVELQHLAMVRKERVMITIICLDFGIICFEKSSVEKLVQI